VFAPATPGIHGGLCSVLFALGLAEKLETLAAAASDVVGLQLEEEHLPRRIRQPRPFGSSKRARGPRMSAPAAFVFVDLDGAAHSVGQLWTSASKGQQKATFRYDPAWLAHPRRFRSSGHEPRSDASPHGRRSALFGALGDSAPDRWGRTLLQRSERARARPKGVRSARFSRSTTCCGHDEIRPGALRFRETATGPFVRESDPRASPARAAAHAPRRERCSSGRP